VRVAVPVEVEWCDREGRRSRAIAADADDAVDVLHRVASSGQPILVDFIQAGGRSLTVGVGRDRSVLCFQSAWDGPNFWSIGSDDGPDTTYFWYGGTQSEFADRQLVSKAVAESALREYIRTGELPGSLEWEAV
jgi:hypothetical protein